MAQVATLLLASLTACLGCSSGDDSDAAPDAGRGAVDHDATADGDGNDAGTAAVAPALAWLKRLDGTEIAQISALADGAVLVASVDRPSNDGIAHLSVSVFEPDGSLRWSQSITAGHPRTPETGPPLAVDAHGDIYLLLGRQDSGAAVRIGDRTLQCGGESCLGLASFNASGALRWLTPIDVALDWHWMTAVDDGVVLGLAFGDRGPIVMAVGADGAERWTQPWPLDIPAPYLLGPASAGAGHFLAGDGADGFYVVGSHTGCGAIARVSAADGSVMWEQPACGSGMVTMLSDVVVMDDGSALARAQTRSASQWSLLRFARNGELTTSAELPLQMRPNAAAGDTALLSAIGSGPIAGIGADGDARFQWPGTIADGALSPQPSGFCQADLAPAPDGDVYVLSRGCASARALLGAPALSEIWTDPLDEAPYDQWFVARLRLREDYRPTCGNGLLDPGERCDGDDFDNPDVVLDGTPHLWQCSEWLQGAGYTGAPACSDDCKIDLSVCDSSCGNGMLDEGESCDGELFRGAQSCDEANLGSGPLGCQQCEVDFSVCPMRASCGNGVREDWEACDGMLIDPAQGPPSCQEIGMVGTITCIECRAVDLSSCMEPMK
jgi:hypothetical protein